MKTANKLTIKEARQALDECSLTAVALTEACLARIKSLDEDLRACLDVNEELALQAAKAADERLAAGERGPLLGIPYLAKDNILAKGFKATAASAMLADYRPSFDATIISRLRAAGAVLLGKTNLDEFAHGASTETSFYGPTKNPWDQRKSPGGSSGGSAAAVASDMCLFALGTDTGGSIRHPAAFCGVVGLKPSYGLVSRFGLIAMTSSTDVPGPLTKTVDDAAMVLSVLAGSDERDATTVEREYAEPDCGKDLTGWKIGVPAEFMTDDVDEQVKQSVRQAIDYLQQAGAEIVELNLPHAPYGVSVYYIITPSEISSNLARYDGWRYGATAEAAETWQQALAQARGQHFGAEVKRRIMLGTYVLSAGYYDAYYLRAQKVRTKIIEDFNRAFSQVDAIIGPTTPNTAFALGGQSKDPLKMYLEDIFLTPASLAGLPALSLPAGLAEGMPVGLQVITDRFAEDKLFCLARVLEADFGRLRPRF